MGAASAVLKLKARTKQETVVAPYTGENQMRGLDFGDGALVRQEKIDLDDIDSWAASKTDRRQQTGTRGARSLKKMRTNSALKRSTSPRGACREISTGTRWLINQKAKLIPWRQQNRC
jgi:hypothetical protein